MTASVRVRRQLSSLPPVDLALELRPRVEVATLFACFTRAASGTLNRATEGMTAVDMWRRMRALVPEARLTWQLALRDETPIGVVFPRRLRRGKVASLAFIGLVPEARGRGSGRALHAAALHHAAETGATEYVDVTDIRNLPMRRVFAANGCTETQPVITQAP